MSFANLTLLSSRYLQKVKIQKPFPIHQLLGRKSINDFFQTIKPIDLINSNSFFSTGKIVNNLGCSTIDNLCRITYKDKNTIIQNIDSTLKTLQQKANRANLKIDLDEYKRKLICSSLSDKNLTKKKFRQRNSICNNTNIH